MTKTTIATSTPTDIIIRGKSLPRELIGNRTFTEMIWFDVLGEMPSAGQRAVLDACLVALMEHGLTPSALATRLVYGSAPEAMQGAVAAGLAGVGSVFVGTVEGCARLLVRMVAAPDPVAEAVVIVREANGPLPGFGHNLHRPDDPRPPRLFDVATRHGIAGRHVAALQELGAALDAGKRRHITINATGAIAAVLLDAGAPAEILRGFAIIARCAGLVAHIREEQSSPSMAAIWDAAERAVPYHAPEEQEEDP